MFKVNRSNRSAFTLIELLIVIGIIGLLASLIIVSINSAQRRAQDAQRKNFARTIDSALSSYYTDNNNHYPVFEDDTRLDSDVCDDVLVNYISSSTACRPATTAVYIETGDGAGNPGDTHFVQGWGLAYQSEKVLTSMAGNGSYQLVNDGALSFDGVVEADFYGMQLGEDSPINEPADTRRAFVTYGPQ